ncbi:hypothetical protein CBL_10706 [Carabus blaptoides fortunei]
MIIGASPLTPQPAISMSHRRPGTIRQRPHCVRRRQVTDGVATQACNRTVPLGVYRQLVGCLDWAGCMYVRTYVITDEDPFVNSKLRGLSTYVHQIIAQIDINEWHLQHSKSGSNQGHWESMSMSCLRVRELEYISQAISSKDDGRAVKATRRNPSAERMDGWTKRP